MTKAENQIQFEDQQTFIQEDKQAKCFFSQFQNKFETIKAFVEDLKQLQIQITAKEDSSILNYTKTIVNYLEHPEGLLNEKLYKNSLISLGSFLSIKYSFLERENLSDRFYKNLVDYFCILCEKQEREDFNMLVYPVFYIIVLMIYNSDKETSSKLFSKIFTKKFLRALCSVEFKEGNKVERYLPVMIAFIAKGVSGEENNALLKELVLRNLHFSEMQKNQFQFIYSLRILINKDGFSMSQIRKYNLLEHLTRLMEKNIHLQQQVSMILQVMKHILKRHQILGYKIVSMNVMGLLQKAYKICGDETLGLLEIICPCLQYRWKSTMLQAHTAMLQKYSCEDIESIGFRQIESLKIISIVIQEIQFEDMLQLLSCYSVDNLLRRTFEGKNKTVTSQEQDIVVKFVIKIIGSLETKNSIIKMSLIEFLSLYKDKNRKLQLFIEKHLPVTHFLLELE